jgi:hypothetical protein
MHFPFLTSEVKCGASALDIADRQNAHSQTVLLRGIFELFRVVGREEEVLTKINGFSFSHNDLDVRIWGHLLVKEENELKFYREPIATFSFLKTQQTDNRWTGWKFFRNILDIWVTDHFKWICSAIDDLPSGLNFEMSELSKFQYRGSELASLRSQLSQQLGEHNLAEKRFAPDIQPSFQQITATAITHTKSNRKRQRK